MTVRCFFCGKDTKVDLDKFDALHGEANLVCFACCDQLEDEVGIA